MAIIPRWLVSFFGWFGLCFWFCFFFYFFLRCCVFFSSSSSFLVCFFMDVIISSAIEWPRSLTPKAKQAKQKQPRHVHFCWNHLGFHFIKCRRYQILHCCFLFLLLMVSSFYFYVSVAMVGPSCRIIAEKSKRRRRQTWLILFVVIVFCCLLLLLSNPLAFRRHCVHVPSCQYQTFRTSTCTSSFVIFALSLADDAHKKWNIAHVFFSFL